MEVEIGLDENYPHIPIVKGSLFEIKYTIASYSSYSEKFEPEKIIEDNPKDQTSRWSSDSHIPPQFLILKLESPCIVTHIKFGKYEKSHVCNVKKIHISGGMTQDNLILLLECYLKNDSIPEAFPLKYKVGQNAFPIRYIKLEPLQAWGSTFNCSIWHVKLLGCADKGVVASCLHSYAMHAEREAVRLCLKHLRHKRYKNAYDALKKEAHTTLEHPVLSELYIACTEQPETYAVEKILKMAAEAGLFKEYIQSQPLTPIWTQLVPPIREPFHSLPGMRGGHQLCIDTNTGTIYLFGGWDGQKDLNDFWSYSIAANEWTCISLDTTQQGGPTARSCHKMCLDAERKQIFTLGRYVDNKQRTAALLKNDFHLYEIDRGQWTQISEDTAEVGGPKLLFDHQMVMDTQNRVIYVFGGRVLTLSRWEGVGQEGERGAGFSPADPLFSGLFKYHVATNTWTCLREDSGSNTTNPNGTSQPTDSASIPTIKSRVGHSMLFDNTTRQLYILAGQRFKEYLTDFLTYQIDTDSVTAIVDQSFKDIVSCSVEKGSDTYSFLQMSGAIKMGETLVGGPTAGFTQKATIDPELQEIHVLSGLSKEKEKRDMVCHSLWVYTIPLNRWSCIYHNELSSDAASNPKEPCPRFAHQLVYDHVNKVHYMFGGNPGRQSKMRLDDFWSLKLERPCVSKAINQAIFSVRKNRFQELAVKDSKRALHYLQNDLNEVVDHTDEEQVADLQKLGLTIFKPADPETDAPPPLCRFFDSKHDIKIQGFEQLLDLPQYRDIGAGASTRYSEDPEEQFEEWRHCRRSELFNSLTRFFPDYLTQPKGSLEEFVKL